MWEAIKKFGKDLVDAFKDMLMDLFVWSFEMVVDIAIHIIEGLSLPTELLNQSISMYVNADIAYFLALSGLDQCMVIIGAAVLFRMARKFVTLGLW